MGKPSSQRVIVMLLFVLGFSMATHVFQHFNPGALSPDSLSILAQARTGIFEDGHPPLMAAIWRLVDSIIPGSIGMLVLNLGLFYGGLFLIFRWAVPKYRINVLLGFLFVGLFPPVIGILGVIWIDITMAGFFLLALGIFLAADVRKVGFIYIAAFLISMILVSLGIAIRHNAATAAFPLITFFFFQSMQNWARPLARLSLAVFIGAVFTLLLFIGTKQISSWYVDVPRHFWRVAALYDIAGTSYNANAPLFYPELIQGDDIGNIRALYSPRSLTPLLIGQQVHALYGEPVVEGQILEFNTSNSELNQQLKSNWMEVVVSHPVAYLKHRFDVFTSLVTRSPWGLWAPVFDVVYPNNMGIFKKNLDDSIYFVFVKTLALRSVVFVPLLYLVLSLLAVFPTLIYGLRLNNHTLLLVSGLYGSGIAHMFGLFFIAASADFRYSHWMITTTILASTLLALEFVKIVLNHRMLRSPCQRHDKDNR